MSVFIPSSVFPRYVVTFDIFPDRWLIGTVHTRGFPQARVDGGDEKRQQVKEL